MHFILIFVFIIGFTFSCAHKTKPMPKHINVTYILTGNYIFQKRENEFKWALRKNLPENFNLLNYSMTTKLLRKENLEPANIKPVDLEKIADIFPQADLIILINPLYIKVEESFEETGLMKCGYKKGYGLIKITIYDKNSNKIMLKNTFDSYVQKKKCLKDIYPDMDIYPNSQVRKEIIDKIFSKAFKRLVKEN